MEALLEKEADVESWNDERLDELSRRTDAGFEEMRAGFVRIEQEMKKGFADVATRKDVQAVDDRLFTLICALIVAISGIIGTLIVING
jgi:hypothetical protein